MKRPPIRNKGDSAGNLAKPKGSFCFCFSKSEKVPIARPIKYSMMEARLLPAQDTIMPINGPKMAPLRITIGSVGMGVADRIPMSKMENNGPAIPVVGMNLSIFLISLAKKTMVKTGRQMVMIANNIFLIFLTDMVYFIIRDECIKNMV